MTFTYTPPSDRTWPPGRPGGRQRCPTLEDEQRSNAMPARILSIDADRSSQRTVTHVLRQQGYDVESASTGQDGVRAIEKLAPHLIVIDLVLPDADGYELTTKIRASLKSPHV